MDEPLNLFPKRQKFPILQPDELLKSRWLDEFFIEMTMKVITLLRVSTDYFLKNSFDDADTLTLVTKKTNISINSVS